MHILGQTNCLNNEYGTCVSWTCSDGKPLPTNYNGLRANCDKFEEQLFTKTLKVIKSCPTKALENGCLTDEYRGTDKVKQELNSSNPDYKADPNIDFSDTNIKNKYSAWVLSNGMVIFKYGTYKSNYPIYTIDINGHKKPNKWGHDIFTFTLKGNEDGITSMVGSTYATEKGGKSATQMINEQ